MNNIHTFSSPSIPIPEVLLLSIIKNDSHQQITKFLQIEKDYSSQLSHRPYISSNYIASIDGIISFKEEGEIASKEIALGHIKDSGSEADWRLLQGGWCVVDAVITTSREPDYAFSIDFEDLVEFRERTLKKPPQPLQVFLTKRGEFDFSQKNFSLVKVPKLIATTKEGKRVLLERAYKYLNASERIDKEVHFCYSSIFNGVFKGVEKCLQTTMNIQIKDFPTDTDAGVSLRALLAHLKSIGIIHLVFCHFLLSHEMYIGSRCRSINYCPIYQTVSLFLLSDLTIHQKID